jgi:hypothetical protein
MIFWDQNPMRNDRMIFHRRHYFIFLVTSCFYLCTVHSLAQERQETWPPVSKESKPWTRWWWHGSALTKEGITAEMEAYHKAGIGGLEITPIYGVYGAEDQFVDYLSPKWMDLLMHVLKEGTRLGMGIDMATGTGWPFGGPWVTEQDACKNLRYKSYEIYGGQKLQEKIEFIQEPYLRLVGNQIYEVQENAEAEGRKLAGTRKEPGLIPDTKNIKIEDLMDPVSQNKNLQALAIDQIKFQKPLKLKLLMGYGEKSQVIDLTSHVSPEGALNWTAPPGKWKLYAIFEGYHGKMVERAGPGGEGNVIDHFSDVAVRNYLRHFDNAFEGQDIRSLRGFFNDSYEVDDARGAADFTPALFQEFLWRRGYDLKNELPALLGHDTEEKNTRVLCDYRETISELLLDNFTKQWKGWANEKGAIVRNQAHGSPANILDLYAVVDIPEIEGTEPLRFKMATSSGNVSAKKLVSAEAATWLNEHFESSLADIKRALDKFMLHGVNHLFYHGTCYSPADEAWPGRLFYAAVHLNPRNPQWKDFDALNNYVARCQSFLQRSAPDNDILLYYPVYDRFSAPGQEMVEHFDGIGKSFAGTSFADCADRMLEKGYAFDFISDKQIQETSFENGFIKTSGNTLYKTIVVPSCNYMPLGTLERIVSLAKEGATVILIFNGPASVSGYKDLEARKKRFSELMSEIGTINTVNILKGNDIVQLLENAGIQRETMVDAGIHCIRKKSLTEGAVYFIANTNASEFEGWLSVRGNEGHFAIYDPMINRSGNARIRKTGMATEVFVKLRQGESLILEGHNDSFPTDMFPYQEITGNAIPLKGKWKVSFVDGGPSLPSPFETDSLIYWTDRNDATYKDFSGTATYELSFRLPRVKTSRWLLSLDSVKESAEVVLNGQSIGKMIGPIFQIDFDASLLKKQNTLQIKVSNLMSNRIAYLDRKNIFWKKFYNVNFPARKKENMKNNLFNAAHWKTKPSGISGKLLLYPIK